MATLLSIDETPLDQATTNDSDAALPSPFTGLGTPIETALKEDAISFSGGTIDIVLGDNAGAALNGAESGLFALDGQQIYLYSDPSNNNMVIGRVGSAGAEDSGGAIVFAIYLDPQGGTGDAGASTGDLWVALYQPLLHGNDTSPNDIESLVNKIFVTATQPTGFDASGAPSGQNLFLMFGDGTPSEDDITLVVTSEGAANQSAGAHITTGATVNSGQGGGGTTLGTSNQMVDPNEAMYFTFVKGANVDYTVKNLDQTEADVEANIDFDELVETTSASFSVVQCQPNKRATLEIAALKADMNPGLDAGSDADDTPWTGVDYIDNQDENESVNISEVVVTRNVIVRKVSYVDTFTFTEGGGVVGMRHKVSDGDDHTNDTVIADASLTCTFAGTTDANNVIIKGLKAGDNISYVSDDPHNRVLVTNTGNVANFNSAFDIGDFQMQGGEPSTDPLGPIDFYDDGPDANLALTEVTLVVDESVGADTDDANADDEDDPDAPSGAIGYAALAGNALFTDTSSTGADAEGAGSAYSLRVDAASSSLSVSDSTLTALNAAITLVKVGNDVEGQYNGGANVAFRITIDADSGKVELIQYAALVHGDTSSLDEALALGSGKVSAVLTVTDGDGDESAADVDIGAIMSFEDDGPWLDDDSGENLTVDNFLGDTAQGDYDLDGGKDTVAAVEIIAAPNDGDFAFVKVDSNSITGTLGGNALYKLDINNDGTYDFELTGVLPKSTTTLDTANIKAGGPDTNFIDVGAVDSLNPQPGSYVRISGFYDPPGALPRDEAAVNESNANVGVSNGNLDAGETLTFRLYEPDGPDLNDDPDLQQITGITIGTKTPKITDYTYTLYKTLANGDLQVVGTANTPYDNVPKNGSIEIDAPAGLSFDTVELTAVDAEAVKIGLGDIVLRRLPNDVLLEFTVSLTDSDGDSTDATFYVGIDGNEDGIFPAPPSTLAATSLSADSSFLSHDVGDFDPYASLRHVDQPMI